jgi:hypothetical protein
MNVEGTYGGDGFVIVLAKNFDCSMMKNNSRIAVRY